MVISILISQGIPVDSTVAPGNLLPEHISEPLFSGGRRSPQPHRTSEQLMETSVRNGLSAPCPKTLKTKVFLLLSKFGAVIHLITKPDLN